MTARTDLYDSTYGHFADRVLADVRADTFGRDIGQNSWTTAEEYERFASWLGVDSRAHVLEVACGSGGPACHLAATMACRVTGIDANHHGASEALRAARAAGLDGLATFVVADANSKLPFARASFDGIVCTDAMNHFVDRRRVLAEWRRVLRPGGKAVFTDPVVVSGPVTSEELAQRSSIGAFLFVPHGTNERLIDESSLRLVRRDDVSEPAVRIAGRWHRARQARRDDLLRIEGAERFEGLQQFLRCVERLTDERKLSRFVYLVERAADG